MSTNDKNLTKGRKRVKAFFPFRFEFFCAKKEQNYCILNLKTPFVVGWRRTYCIESKT
jgi:hypothetical protein